MNTTQRRVRIRPIATVLAAAALVAAALTGCSNSSSTSDGDSPFVIRVGYALSTQANFYYALQNDLFGQHGVKIEGTSFANGTDLVTALVAGSLDVGMIGVPPTMTADAKGADLQVFGISMDQGVMDGLYVSPDSGITSVDDLRGKTVGTTQGSSSDVLLHFALDEAGIDYSEVNVQYLTPPALVAGYQRGDLSAVWTFSTPGSSIIAAGGKEILSATDLGLSSPLVYAASAQYIADNADGLKDFLAAIDEGSAATNGDTKAWTAAYLGGSGVSKESADISAKYLSDNGVTMEQATDPSYVNALTTPDGFAAVLASYGDVMVKLGILKESLDTSKLVTDVVVR